MQKIEEDAARQRQIKAFKDAVTEERKEMQRQALLQSVEMERKVAPYKIDTDVLSYSVLPNHVIKVDSI